MGNNASTRTVLSVENINNHLCLVQSFGQQAVLLYQGYSGMGFRDLTVFRMGEIKRKVAKKKVERRYQLS